MAKVEARPLSDTLCETPPNTIRDEDSDSVGSYCHENWDEKEESKSDTVMGDSASDGARDREEALLQQYIKQLINANLDARPLSDTLCETPPNTIRDGDSDSVGSYCHENWDEKEESKSDTVMGDSASDGARDREEALLQQYIKQLINANPKAHTNTLQLQDQFCGYFICPPGLVHTLLCTNTAIFLSSVPIQKSHFLLATGIDNNGVRLYLAWALVKFENPDIWDCFLENLKTALRMVPAEFIRFVTNKPGIRRPLSQQFPCYDLRTDSTFTIKIDCGDILLALSRLWEHVAFERSSQRSKVLDYMETNGWGGGLTPYGQTRMDRFNTLQGFEFKSICWDQESCDGFAKIVDLAKSQMLEVSLHISDDQATTSCTCKSDVEPEGHCSHALITVAMLMNCGLNAAKFTPYNIRNWLQCYLCNTDKMESPFGF